MHLFRYERVDGDDVSLSAWFDLRRDLYLAEDFLAPDDLDADGRYADQYDPHSVHVLVFDEADRSVPIGTCRIIDGRRTQLQVGAQFGVEHGADALEMSGFALQPAYRKTFASLGCYRLVYEHAVRGGYSEVHFEVELPFRDALAAVGLPLEQTGCGRHVYNTFNVPIRVTIDAVVPSLRAADRKRGGTTHFADLFEAPFDGTLDTGQLFSAAQPEELAT